MVSTSRFLPAALFSIVALCCIGGTSQADVVSLDATDAGFVTEMGGSAKGDGMLVAPATFNYSAGWEEHFVDGSLGTPPGSTPLAFMNRKNYFVFDLSTVTGVITEASLELYAGPDIGDDYPDGMHGYESLDPFEAFDILETTDPDMAISVADVLLEVATIAGSTGFDEPTDPGVIGSTELYGLLGDGAVLASYSVTSDDDDTTISLEFTAAGLAYLNMFTGERLILAGDIGSLAEIDGVTEGIFGYTGPDIPGGDPLTPSLVLTTVPEPSVGIALLFLVLLVFVPRKRRWSALVCRR